MNCPLCIDSTLDVTYHAGIEVDVCPWCREFGSTAASSSPWFANPSSLLLAR